MFKLMIITLVYSITFWSSEAADDNEAGGSNSSPTPPPPPSEFEVFQKDIQARLDENLQNNQVLQARIQAILNEARPKFETGTNIDAKTLGPIELKINNLINQAKRGELLE